MRDYVDGVQGKGVWDRMHDILEKGPDLATIGDWDLPEITVDGVTVAVFPGTNREVTLEDVEGEVARVLAENSNKGGHARMSPGMKAWLDSRNAADVPQELLDDLACAMRGAIPEIEREMRANAVRAARVRAEGRPLF